MCITSMLYIRYKFFIFNNVKKLSLYLTKKALHHEGVWGSGCIDLHFLDLSTSWR
jgi:hypothetical protein